MKNNATVFGLIFAAGTFVGAVSLFIRITHIDPAVMVKPISNALISIPIPIRETKKTTRASLTQTLQGKVSALADSYGIVVMNLNADETYRFNEHERFQSGSLYKLWVMATAFDMIKNGQLNESDILQQEIPILNEKFRIATEDAELTEGTITLSVGDALYQMITVSDNYAALLLSEKIRLSTVAQFLKQHGFMESTIGTTGGFPTTTASDIAQFFILLYQGKLINKEYDDKMINLLKQQKLNHKIPKYLPKNTIIAHKTGELGPFSHDAGIVYTQKGDYIIVILSKSTNPLRSVEKIVQLSEIVYQYMMGM